MGSISELKAAVCHQYASYCEVHALDSHARHEPIHTNKNHQHPTVNDTINTMECLVKMQFGVLTIQLMYYQCFNSAMEHVQQ